MTMAILGADMLWVALCFTGLCKKGGEQGAIEIELPKKLGERNWK